MDHVTQNAPVPSDYFGVLWALAGIQDALILEHGATGTAFYNAVSFSVMNKQSPKGKLFTTGLTEDDVVMGREDKIMDAAMELDRRFSPRVIALAATAVTSVIGLDLDGIARELQPRVKARLLAFPGGGFQGDYTLGIKDVFRAMASEVAEDCPVSKTLSVNLIGPTLDSFNYPSDLAEIKRLLGLLGVGVNTVFTHATSVLRINQLPSASLNIVLRDIGCEAARILSERFGTPYHYGLPFGIRGTVEFLEQVAEKLGIRPNRKRLAEDLKMYGYTLSELSSWWHRFGHLKVVISCPYDYALGLARLVREEWELPVTAVILPTVPEDPDPAATFQQLGISTVLVAPPEEEVKALYDEIRPHILFGHSFDFLLAKETPIKIHAAMPAYDYLYLHDGTPFVGLKGSLYLTQTLVNQISRHKEVMIP